MSDQNKEEIQSTTKFDEINKTISLIVAKEGNKLETEERNPIESKGHGMKIVIYVGNDSIISIPGTFFQSIEETIKEIDEAEYNDHLERRNDFLDDLFDILVENIHDWSKNNYDTQFLYYKIALPLLKKLREVGETKFQIIFQQEILKTYVSGNLQIKEFLDREGYLKLIGDFF
ncbi:MAG: hypothetical protein ACW986_00855 [Promethearchaeota archaeon]|jgi:hypothetical protein